MQEYKWTPMLSLPLQVLGISQRMNPPNFFDFKVEEDPQGFIAEVFKVLDAMGVSSQEKEEQDAYQLNDVTQVWYKQ